MPIHACLRRCSTTSTISASILLATLRSRPRGNLGILLRMAAHTVRALVTPSKGGLAIGIVVASPGWDRLARHGNSPARVGIRYRRFRTEPDEPQESATGFCSDPDTRSRGRARKDLHLLQRLVRRRYPGSHRVHLGGLPPSPSLPFGSTERQRIQQRTATGRAQPSGHHVRPASRRYCAMQRRYVQLQSVATGHLFAPRGGSPMALVSISPT